MKHIGTFVVVFLILLSFEVVRADEVAATPPPAAAEAAPAPTPDAQAAPAAEAPAANTTVQAPPPPAEAAPAPVEAASASATEVAASPVANERAPASIETGTPAPAPEAKPAVDEPKMDLVRAKKHKKWKQNGLRKVKSACEILNNPEGTKIGILKLERKLWTDEIDKEGWYKVTRKDGPGYVKKECFEQAQK